MGAGLLRLLLFLLADANLELLLLGFLVSLPIEALRGLGDIGGYVGVFGQHGHQSSRHASVRTADAIALNIWNSHKASRITRDAPLKTPGGAGFSLQRFQPPSGPGLKPRLQAKARSTK